MTTLVSHANDRQRNFTVISANMLLLCKVDSQKISYILVGHFRSIVLLCKQFFTTTQLNVLGVICFTFRIDIEVCNSFVTPTTYLNDAVSST